MYIFAEANDNKNKYTHFNDLETYDEGHMKILELFLQYVVIQ